MSFPPLPRPARRSIGRMLTLGLVPTFMAVALLTAGLSYWMFTHMVTDFLDDQMVQLADSVARHGPAVELRSRAGEPVFERGIYVMQVFTPEGRLLASSWDGVPARRMPREGLQVLQENGRSWRVYATSRGTGVTVQIMQSEAFRQRLAYERAAAAALPVLLLLPLSMAVLLALARSISRTLAEVGRQAESQDADGIEAIPLDPVPAEIRPLVNSFNALLGRLRDSLSAQRRFVQDAAHELRTPIAAVMVQSDNLRHEIAGDRGMSQLEQLEAGARRARRLVDQLLKLSRQEAEPVELATTLDLRDQLRESVRGLVPLADQCGIDLGLEGTDGREPVALQCAAPDLRSALDNIIENAIRYTPAGGVVDVRLTTPGGRTVVEVVDSGPGVPPELLPRLFDRFYRVPGSTAAGSGLGLAIARAAARRCGLVLTLHNRGERPGLIARLEAPGTTSASVDQ